MVCLRSKIYEFKACFKALNHGLVEFNASQAQANTAPAFTEDFGFGMKPW